MVVEFEGGLRKVADGTVVGADFALAVVLLAVPLGQGGLRIESVDLARPAVHEEEYDMLCVGAEMRDVAFVAGEEITQRQAGEAATGAQKEIAAVEVHSGQSV